MDKIKNVTDQYVVLLSKTRKQEDIRKLLEKFFLARVSELEQQVTELTVGASITKQRVQ